MRVQGQLVQSAFKLMSETLEPCTWSTYRALSSGSASVPASSSSSARRARHTFAPRRRHQLPRWPGPTMTAAGWRRQQQHQRRQPRAAAPRPPGRNVLRGSAVCALGMCAAPAVRCVRWGCAQRRQCGQRARRREQRREQRGAQHCLSWHFLETTARQVSSIFQGNFRQD